MAIADLVRHELLEASDEQIDGAVELADPMVLRGLLYQLTGDEEVARVEVKVVHAGVGEARVVAREEDVALLRRKAAAFLRRYRDDGALPLDPGPADRLPISLGLTAGETLPNEDLGLWLEDLALDPWGRMFAWESPPPDERLQAFTVAVIGAGMGGLNAALQLKRAGIPYTLIEKNSGVGGTWFENHYPGARVDTPSRSYTHTFAVDIPYPYPFCDWRENQKYFDWIADTFELRDDIVFDTEVLSMAWDDEASVWSVRLSGPDGEQTIRVNAVMTSVGFLNRAKVPEIEGMSSFRGSSWHSSRWPEGFEHAGKRIAVIGTGCTGYQMVPELALDAAEVVVFQRRPQWIVPVAGYSSPYPREVGWLDRNLPYHTNFMRFRSTFGVMSFARMRDIDPNFSDAEELSAATKNARANVMAFLEEKLVDPDLVAKMTPPHPVLSARPVVVDPEYSVLDAIQRDNVTLVTEGIRRVNETGIEANDGTQHDVDVIVFATGFHATEYLFPMQITGRGGMTLDELWRDGGARAHRFCTLPNFPNLFMIYGPNTNGGLNVAGFHELVTRYALECIERVLRDGGSAIEPTMSAYRDYNIDVDRRNAAKTWSDPRGHGYHWSAEHGRSAVMCPFDGPEVWRLLRHPPFDELVIR